MANKKELTALERYEQEIAEWDEFIAKHFVKGRHFDDAKQGTGLTLLKAGAEEAMRFKGYNYSAYSNEIRDAEGKIRGWYVTVSMTDGECRQISEGMGACTIFKPTNFKPKQTAKGKHKVVDFEWNFAIKMAKKRAMVDAVLSGTKLSARFTQDMEDRPTSVPDNDDDFLKEPAPPTQGQQIDNQFKVWYDALDADKQKEAGALLAGITQATTTKKLADAGALLNGHDLNSEEAFREKALKEYRTKERSLKQKEEKKNG